MRKSNYLKINDFITKELFSFPKIFDRTDKNCYLGSEIPIEKKDLITKESNIEPEEEILFLFNANINGPTFFTYKGIYIATAESFYGPSSWDCYPWENINNINLNQNEDLFEIVIENDFELITENVLIESLSPFIINHTNYEFSEVLNNIAKKIPYDRRHIFEKLKNQKTYNKKYYTKCLELIDYYDENSRYSVFGYYYLGKYYYKNKNYVKALENFITAENLHNDLFPDDVVSPYEYYLWKIYKKIGECYGYELQMDKSWNYLQRVFSNIEEPHEVAKMSKCLNRVYNFFINAINNNEIEHPNIIYLENNFFELVHSEKITYFQIDNIPQITFPENHSKSNTIYAQHPFNLNYYIPLIDLKFELVKEELWDLLTKIKKSNLNIKKVIQINGCINQGELLINYITEYLLHNHTLTNRNQDVLLYKNNETIQRISIIENKAIKRNNKILFTTTSVSNYYSELLQSLIKDIDSLVNNENIEPNYVNIINSKLEEEEIILELELG